MWKGARVIPEIVRHEMTANIGGGGAKIYAFPKGGRAGLRAVREQGKQEFPVAAPSICGDGWYHEAAMREETPRKQ